MDHVDAVVVGAGVIGLAVARALTIAGDDDLVVVAGSFYLLAPARAAIVATG